MKCPHCNKQIQTPTAKEIEAYVLYCIHGLTLEDIGDRLNISFQAVHKRLKGLKAKNPELFEHMDWRINHKETISLKDDYLSEDEDEIVKKF